jgi:hypothetical protein
LISTHSSPTGHHVDGYQMESCTIGSLCSTITKQVWSHCLWAGGYREEFSFVGSYYAVFDFDEGMTKDEAREVFKGYQFILGPTKSDGLKKWTPKNGNVPACDRFRVVVPWASPIWDTDIFRYNIKFIVGELGADVQAVDAARCWQPCKSIYAVGEGKGIDVVTTLPLEETDEYKLQKRKDSMQYYKEVKTFPPYVMRLLSGRHKVSRGDINGTLFKACCFLFDYGFTYAQVLDVLEKVPGMSDHSHFCSTVKSAANKVGAL